MAENTNIPEGLIKMILTGASKADIIAAYGEDLYNQVMNQTDAVNIETTDNPML